MLNLSRHGDWRLAIKFLKWFALTILNFLLFVALTVFGVAFLLNSTVLNPKFIATELNRINISDLVQEAIQSSGQAVPPEIKSSLLPALAKIEPELKTQTGVAISEVYAYLRGSQPEFDLASILGDSLLNRDFVVGVVNELDIAALSKPFVDKQIAGMLPQGLSSQTGFITQNSDKIVKALEPWMKQQVAIAAGPALDYLLGKSDHMNIVLQLGPALDAAKPVIKAVFLASPPPELAGLTGDQLSQLFDQIFPQLIQSVPAQYTINESLLAPARAELAQVFSEAQAPLAQAKLYVGYFQLAYLGLIALIVLLVLLIVLIHHNVKDASRGLGWSFATYGAIELAGVLIGKYFADMYLPQVGLPAAFQSWLPALVNDAISPIQNFTLGILILGVVLIVVSYVYKTAKAGK